MKLLSISGLFLLGTGMLGIILGLLGIIDFGIFSYGISSGIRMVGSVAILGCLLSAIGYGWSEYFDTQSASRIKDV
jgi:hypothetical protein